MWLQGLLLLVKFEGLGDSFFASYRNAEGCEEGLLSLHREQSAPHGYSYFRLEDERKGYIAGTWHAGLSYPCGWTISIDNRHLMVTLTSNWYIYPFPCWIRYGICRLRSVFTNLAWAARALLMTLLATQHFHYWLHAVQPGQFVCGMPGRPTGN
jgi:hypothetical protein